MSKPCDPELTHSVKDHAGGEWFVKVIWIQPGEAWTHALPDKGRSVSDKVMHIMAGEWDFLREVTVNHTTEPIRVFEGENRRTGLPCTPFWECHLRLETLTPLETPLETPLGEGLKNT